VRPRLVELLEKIRAQQGVAVHIVSGYRCPIHNAQVGGAHDSQHVYGAAADIRLPKLTGKEAHALGAVGVGTKNGMAVHVDVRDGAPASWVY
jgi:zinc D-Ala-D-Ala carboxypeptidase